MIEQCLAYLSDGVVADRGAGIDAGDLGADVPGERNDADAGRDDGVGHGAAFRFGACGYGSAAGRGQPSRAARRASSLGCAGVIGAAQAQAGFRRLTAARSEARAAGAGPGGGLCSAVPGTDRAGYEEQVHVAAPGSVMCPHDQSMSGRRHIVSISDQDNGNLRAIPAPHPPDDHARAAVTPGIRDFEALLRHPETKV